MITGKLAAEIGYSLELKVLKSNRGYYLGTIHEYVPMSRESEEYFSLETLANKSLTDSTWTQRLYPVRIQVWERGMREGIAKSQE